ncbi:hypothetical protein EIP86_000654 [Pleurotus ostreatoroseus]|nr:hypothetical protein EIP86_000654 [Pleurotus ostreatoroseus]
MPNFELSNIEEIASREGIEVDADPTAAITYQLNGSPTPSARSYPLRSEGVPPPDGSPRGYAPYPQPGQPMMPPPGYPMPMPYGAPYPPMHMAPPMQGPPPVYGMHPPPPPPPPFQHPITCPAPPARPPSAQETRARETLPHDLTTTRALVRNFGVSDEIVGDIKLEPTAIEQEDIGVGLGGLESKRDRDIADPRDSDKWLKVAVRRKSTLSPTTPTASGPGASIAETNITVWLPKDREMVATIVDVYFTRLNIHRPVLTRASFQRDLDELYKGGVIASDPGFVCSVYLVLALGTLSELNDRIDTRHSQGQGIPIGPSVYAEVMPAHWPTSEDLFERALAVKPDLRVTISSLQALILLHWYLYTERQGRTLWRLVGSLVRLSIELGLHHDPTVPPEDGQPGFSDEEAQLRIRLWAIVLVHDRGTSILLGRPLAISPSDTNTPHPSRKDPEISEHFMLSAPIAEIQADIINSLYAPIRQTEDSIMRHASRIMKSMTEFRKQMPEEYKYFFSGTEEWSTEQRIKLVQDITEDQGLTLLKIGIARILLLRALFSAKELDIKDRHRALLDAIVTSHNIIIVHNQLIKFPDIAFFVSPIPLHIAAMVILYGHMSKCDKLPLQVALEDVWMALDMLPQFRWKWERKDMNGGHPLIAKLAEEVLKVKLHQVSPTMPPMLFSESDWESEGLLSPKNNGPNPATPPMGPAQYAPSYMTHSPNGSAIKPSPGKGAPIPGTPGGDKKLADLPPGIFYPFYPESSAGHPATSALVSVQQAVSNYGYQPSQDSYVLEEKDRGVPLGAGMAGVPVWPNGHHDPRAMAPYQMPS